MIHAAKEIDVSGWQKSRDVARPIHSAARRKWIGQEPLRRQLWLAEIAANNTFATNVQRAGLAARYRT